MKDDLERDVETLRHYDCNDNELKLLDTVELVVGGKRQPSSTCVIRAMGVEQALVRFRSGHHDWINYEHLRFLEREEETT